MKNERTGEERTATSTESGSYVVSALRPSIYTVTASAQNLRVRASNVQLLVGQELVLDLAVQATGVEAKVDIVAAAATGIDTGSATMGVNVNPREVEALPLNGPPALTALLAGTGLGEQWLRHVWRHMFQRSRSATECDLLRRQRVSNHRRFAGKSEWRSAITVSSPIESRECAGVSR